MDTEHWCMQVEIETLQRAVDRVCQYLKDNGHSTVEITDDYYWDLQDPKERFNVNRMPGQLTIGQLSHDWERTVSLAEGQTPPIAFAFVWLSSLLRAIGEKVVG